MGAIFSLLVVAVDILFLRPQAYWFIPKIPTHPSIKGKTVVITGPTSGIGLTTAKAIGLSGAKVILACRDTTRGQALADSWNTMVGSNDAFTVMRVDLSNTESVRQFCKDFYSKYQSLDVLINNAGLFKMADFKRELTPEGYEIHLQSNYLSHYLLTALLLPALNKSSKNPRIVNVSSIMHVTGNIALDDMNFEKQGSYTQTKAYGRSKLCQIMASTFELQRQLKTSNSQVEVFAVHPGTVQTEVVRSLPGWFRSIYDVVAHVFSLSPEEGAASTLFAASQPSLNGLGGNYIEYCKIRKAKLRLAYDLSLTTRLWNWSCDQVKLQHNWLIKSN